MTNRLIICLQTVFRVEFGSLWGKSFLVVNSYYSELYQMIVLLQMAIFIQTVYILTEIVATGSYI